MTRVTGRMRGAISLGQFDERVDPLTLVLNVEAWLPALNELHLPNQRREFVRDVFPADPTGLADQVCGLVTWRCTEV